MADSIRGQIKPFVHADKLFAAELLHPQAEIAYVFVLQKIGEFKPQPMEESDLLLAERIARDYLAATPMPTRHMFFAASDKSTHWESLFADHAAEAAETFYRSSEMFDSIVRVYDPRTDKITSHKISIVSETIEAE